MIVDPVKEMEEREEVTFNDWLQKEVDKMLEK